MNERADSPSASDSSGVRWEQLARADVAPEPQAEGEDTLREFIACALAGDPYAIPVELVREIVRIRAVTPMPRTPGWLVGVISLRGEVVQVVDLRMRLGLDPSPPTRASRIIVLHGEDDGITGVLVDGVRAVLRVSPSDIVPSTATDLRAVREICRNGDEFVSIIEIDAALEAHADL